MAQIPRPVPAERIAVFETSELPGSESTIACALLLGSSEGTLDANRAELRMIDVAGRVRGRTEGRNWRAPVSFCQRLFIIESRRSLLTDGTPDQPRRHDEVSNRWN